jgi:hypothetical protein
VNNQIVKLFGFVLVLYALLFGFTSYWSIFAGRCWRNRRSSAGTSWPPTAR